MYVASAKLYALILFKKVYKASVVKTTTVHHLIFVLLSLQNFH